MQKDVTNFLGQVQTNLFTNCINCTKVRRNRILKDLGSPTTTQLINVCID